MPVRHVFPLDEKFSVLFPDRRDFLRLNVHYQSSIVRRSRRLRFLDRWLLSQLDGDGRWLSPTPREDLLNLAFQSPNLQFKTNILVKYSASKTVIYNRKTLYEM